MLPLIALEDFLSDPHSASGRRVVDRLISACHEPGFCYLTRHGVDPAVEARAMAVANRFFALPAPERQAIAIGNSPHFRGYTVLGDERTQGISDWRDQLDIGPEQPPVRIGPGDPPWLRLLGPNQWPESLPEMRMHILSWCSAMARLAMAVLRALAIGLGQPMNQFDGPMSGNPYTRVKVMRYPEQSTAADTGQGLGLHADSGLLSFVLQDDVGGLQVETADALIDATPQPGTYVMNLGEMLQRASGGFLRATRHRVQSPPVGTQRVAIAYFVNPRLDAEFQPVALPQALADAVAPGARNDEVQDPIHQTFGDNTLKIRMRAHPDVTARFYADVRLPG